MKSPNPVVTRREEASGKVAIGNKETGIQMGEVLVGPEVERVGMVDSNVAMVADHAAGARIPIPTATRKTRV